MEGFSGDDPTKKDNATGIQLLGAILTNGFSPFNPNHHVDEKRWALHVIFKPSGADLGILKGGTSTNQKYNPGRNIEKGRGHKYK